mmetsp:Transcript_46875/g.111581  ORF Transcript_46875/g.111581 Transcript_46875/m.111581 type:complete len:500 (-) Transcript_46875:43-1542(-)
MEGAVQTLAQWREVWRQLALQRTLSEKEAVVLGVNQRMLLPSELEELEKLLHRFDSQRFAWATNFWATVSKLRKRVHALALAGHAGGAATSVSGADTVRLVQDLSRTFQVQVKQHQQLYDSLRSEEETLMSELQADEQRFEAWCAVDSFSCSRAPTRKPTSSPGHRRAQSGGGRSCNRRSGCDPNAKSPALMSPEAVKAEIQAISAEIDKQGGPSGKWSSEDHSLFLELVHKSNCKNGNDLLGPLAARLPLKQHQEIVSHIDWHFKCKGLVQRRKELLCQWRASRSDELRQLASQEAKQEEEQWDELLRREEKSQQQEEAKRARQKEELLQWRDQRTAQRQVEAQSEKERSVREMKQRFHRLQKERAEKQQQIAEFKKRKELEASLDQVTTRAATTASRPSREDEERMAARTAQLLARKREQKQLVQAQRRCSFDPPARSSAYEHVRSRLSESTNATVLRWRDLTELERQERRDGGGTEPGNWAHQGLIRTMRKSASWL